MAILYTTALSANGRKPLLLDHRLGLGLEVEEVNVYLGEGQRPEYLKINPWGRIPTLVDGELVLWESNAVLTYLSERYGESELWSRHPEIRAEINRWLFWEGSSWQPALIAVLSEPVGRRLLAHQQGVPLAEPIGADWEDRGLVPLLEVLERHLSDRPYLVDDRLTLADYSVAAMTMYFGPVGFGWKRFPAFAEWCRRIESTEEWQATARGPWTL